VSCLLAVIRLSMVLQVGSPADVLTSHNTAGRTGANRAETELTPGRVDTGAFGKLWTLYADGQIVAQPLYVRGLAVETSGNPETPRVQGRFNAVLVATMHNTVYLYDADHERPGPDGRTVPLWATWLGKPRPGGADIDMWATNDPEWGILSTPVIDTTRSVVYVVAWHDDGGNTYRYRLHALRLKDGTRLAAPVILEADGLNPKTQKQRTGLVLAGGVLYIAFGGDGSRGLLLAYDATTLARRAVWRSTPTGNDGGIWQAGQAPAVDAQGNLYLMTGNGTFDGHTGGANYGESFVKLHLEGDSVAVKDWFTPCNAAFLNSLDMDLGAAGPVLLPGTDLILGGGKEGRLYLMSTGRLGKHVAPLQPNAQTCPNPNVLQEFKAADGHLHGSPVFWQSSNGTWVYLWGENDRLRAYRYRQRRLDPTPVMGEYRPPDGMPGGMLALSSQGGGGGILWAVAPLNGDANKFRGVKGIVLAVDARNVSKTLWTSEQAGARDRLGLFARFVPPTVAGGKVFIATYGDDEPLRLYNSTVRPQSFPGRYQVVVYGMLPDPTPPVVHQTRDDVQLVTAEVAGSVTIDRARCRAGDAQTLDCTAELQRTAGAPSLEQVVVPAGYNFQGCRLLRVTTATKQAALASALGVGFYAATGTGGQLSTNIGRRVPKDSLKSTGTAVLKNGDPATLHEFAGVVDCTAAPGVAAGKLIKPYVDFIGGPPPTIYRNWDPVVGNYALGGPTTRLDRAPEVLR
jgi:hypothetical protein